MPVPALFRPGPFRSILGWVVSGLVGGSFRPILWVSRFGPESIRPEYIVFKSIEILNTIKIIMVKVSND